MKCETKIKHGCSPESSMRPTNLTMALSTLNQYSSTSNITHHSLLALSSENRKDIEAYKLKVEQRRSMAFELARRNTLR